MIKFTSALILTVAAFSLAPSLAEATERDYIHFERLRARSYERMSQQRAEAQEAKQNAEKEESQPESDASKT
jgi:hypothetical protein